MARQAPTLYSLRVNKRCYEVFCDALEVIDERLDKQVYINVDLLVHTLGVESGRFERVIKRHPQLLAIIRRHQRLYGAYPPRRLC